MNVIRTASLAVLLLFCLPSAAPAEWRGEIDLGEARGSILIVPSMEGRKIVGIRILQIRNIQGNNPLNPDQPVYNRDGTTYDSLDDLLDVDSGVSPPAEDATPAASACDGTYDMKHSGSAPATHRFASIEVDANTGDCVQVHEDGSTGSFLIVQTPPDADPGFQGVAFPDMLAGTWTIIDPAPNDASGNGVRLLDNTPYTLTIQATTGVQVQVTIRIISQGGGEYKLEISNLQKL